MRDLAHHPATARHIALKLARHFVADAPPPDLVASLAATYTKTRGDLSAVYLTLVGSEAAWSPTLVKIRSPLEYFVALLRASGERPKPNAIMAALNAMGQPLWPDTQHAISRAETKDQAVSIAFLSPEFQRR